MWRKPKYTADSHAAVYTLLHNLTLKFTLLSTSKFSYAFISTTSTVTILSTCPMYDSENPHAYICASRADAKVTMT